MKKKQKPNKEFRYERFADEFLVDFNGTQAAIRAGFSKKSAAVTAWRLLRNAKVIARIAAGRKALAEKTGSRAEWVRHRLMLIADASVKDYESLLPESVREKLAGLSRDQAYPLQLKVKSESGGMSGDAVVALGAANPDGTKDLPLLPEAAPTFSTELGLADLSAKLAALQKLGQDEGMFRTKLDVQHGGSVAVTDASINVGAMPAEEQQNLVELLLTAKKAAKAK